MLTTYDVAPCTTFDGFFSVTFDDPLLSCITPIASTFDGAAEKADLAISLFRNSPFIGMRWVGVNGPVLSVTPHSLPTMGPNSETFLVKFENGTELVWTAGRFKELAEKDAFAATPAGISAAQKASVEYAKKIERAAEASKSEELAEAKFIADLDCLRQKGEKDITHAKRVSTLRVLVRYENQTMTRKAFVESVVAKGLTTSTRLINRVQPMSSKRLFRADNNECAAHDRRIKEAGKKTVYSIGGFDVCKIEYDYANALISQKHATA